MRPNGENIEMNDSIRIVVRRDMKICDLLGLRKCLVLIVAIAMVFLCLTFLRLVAGKSMCLNAGRVLHNK